MPAIAILTGSHLCHNPRVVKEATALARAGFDVEVLGAWLDPALRAQDRVMMAELPFRFTPVLDLAEPSATVQLRRLYYRLRHTMGQLAYRIGGLPNRWQFGYAIGPLRRAAHRRRAELYIAHSEAALMVARDLLNSGHRVGVDMEDWFSEDLLPEVRKERPICLLRDLEHQLLLRSAHATCPSHAMSAALAKSYGCPEPAVIFNAFRWSDRQSIDRRFSDRRDRQTPSVHWYSQTLGQGRGLEDLLAALPHLKYEAQIHLRGKPVAGFDSWLAARVSKQWRKHVFVHDLVASSELLSRISEHDIGFAGEMKFCRSRDLTITNKILHYLLAGLAVIASDTDGQREVAQQAHDAVALYPSGDARALADRINALLGSPEQLKRARASALQAAEQTFCWEQQEKILLQSVARAASAPLR